MAEQPQFRALMRLLADSKINMVLVGGVAMVLRSVDYLTFDIDVCYERSFGNVERLCRALAPHCLAIRSAFNDTLSLLQANTQSETFHTDMGRIDFLGEVAGLGDYLAAMQFATLVEIEDFAMYVLTLEGLIRAKEAAGREKDLLHLVTLRALKQMDDEGEA